MPAEFTKNYTLSAQTIDIQSNSNFIPEIENYEAIKNNKSTSEKKKQREKF